MHCCAVIVELEFSNWSHKAGSMKLSKMFWCGEALRVAFNGKRSWTPQKKKRKRKKSQLIYPILQTLRLVNAVRQISLSSIGLPGKVWFSTQLMLYIALGDIRLGCRYSAMETNSMKVLDTVPQLIWRSEVCSDWFCRTLVISAPADPTLWFYVASTLWLSFCDF